MIRIDRVLVPEWLLHRWILVAYKIPPLLDGWRREIYEIAPDEKFQAVVDQYLEVALAGGELPDTIAPAILNLANDVMSGREVTIRAGDYISIMGFAKGMQR